MSKPKEGYDRVSPRQEKLITTILKNLSKGSHKFRAKQRLKTYFMLKRLVIKQKINNHE